MLAAWRERGGDPEQLGPWTAPVLRGVVLQRLALDVQIRERLAEGRTPIELHRAAHQIARAVSSGVIDPGEWRAARVWSRWLDDLLVRAARAEAQQPSAPAASDPEGIPTHELDATTIDAIASSFLRPAAPVGGDQSQALEQAPSETSPAPERTPEPTAADAVTEPRLEQAPAEAAPVPDSSPTLAAADEGSAAEGSAAPAEPRLEQPEVSIPGLQAIAASWSVCRECNRQCTGSLGLHRHVQAAHEIDAWTYYQRWPIALLLRALHESDLEESRVVHLAGVCWVHRGAPDRWGARLRVAGAPTSALYRLTYWAVTGAFPVRYACHSCDNPRCVNPLHVWDGSPRENAADRDAKGRQAARRRALSDEQVSAAAEAHNSGQSWREIGNELGVDAETVRRAVMNLPASGELAHVAAAVGNPNEILW